MQRVVLRPSGMVQSSYVRAPTEGSTRATFYDGASKPTPHFRGCRGVALHDGVRRHAFRSREPAENERRAIRLRCAFASDNNCFFIVGHDGNRRNPPIHTTARLNPATGNGMVMREVGTPHLAMRLTGAWVLLE